MDLDHLFVPFYYLIIIYSKLSRPLIELVFISNLSIAQRESLLSCNLYCSIHRMSNISIQSFHRKLQSLPITHTVSHCKSFASIYHTSILTLQFLSLFQDISSNFPAFIFNSIQRVLKSFLSNTYIQSDSLNLHSE